MATAIFVIPQHDAERAERLLGNLGGAAPHVRMAMQHKPFDPFGADAETQAVDETLVRVTYDARFVSTRQLHAALTALGVHILDTREDDA